MSLIIATLIMNDLDEIALDFFDYTKRYVDSESILVRDNYKIYQYTHNNYPCAIVDDVFNRCRITGLQENPEQHSEKIYDGKCFYHDKNKPIWQSVQWDAGRITGAKYPSKD